MMNEFNELRDFLKESKNFGYVYGATGWVCTPERREKQAKQYPSQAKNILNTSSKWDGKICYDCATFTSKISRMLPGANLPSGATSQWKSLALYNKSISGDQYGDELQYFFVWRRQGSTPTMSHVGFVFEGVCYEAASSSKGCVQNAYSFLNWDYCANLGSVPPKARPTLRRSSAFSEDVLSLQKELDLIGYRFTKSGIDGKYGSETAENVRSFQKNACLPSDGVCGDMTWQSIDRGYFPAP